MSAISITEARKNLFELSKSAFNGGDVELAIRGVGNVTLVNSDELKQLRELKFKQEFDDMFDIYGDRFKELADR